MSIQPISNWGTWQQTRNTLVQNLSMNLDLRNQAAPGSAQADELTQNIDRNLKDMQKHASNGLKKVDANIIASGLAATLTQGSKAAKAEADRIRNATKTVDKLTGLTVLLTSVVAGFGAL